MIGSLISNSLVAYGFSRIKWPGRDKVFILVIITMILPFQITMVPLYLMFNKWAGSYVLTAYRHLLFRLPILYFPDQAVLIGIPNELSASAK